MTTPRAALTSDDIPHAPLSEDDLRRGWNQQADKHNQWESLDSAEQLGWAQARAIAADRARAALKVELEGEGPRPDGDWFAVALVAQDMRSRGLAEQVAGEELLKLANGKRSQPGRAATQPALEPPSPSGYAYRYRSPFGGTCIRFNGGEEVNGGRPIEPVPYWFAPPSAPATPPAPEPGDVGELHPLWYLVEFLEGHSSFLRRTDPTDELAQILSDSATLLQQQQADLATLRGAPVPELDDQHREAVHQAVAEALGSGAYDCLRVWEAWGVGAMGPDDFVLVADDSDRVAAIADAAIEAIRAIPAPLAGEVEA
jgi:hypothetical protein